MAKAGKGPRRAALYVRVSTDGQTVENQRRELEAIADRHGWQIAHVFADEGISGAKGRDRRPAFDALWKGIGRRDFDVVMAWSVDRLGRSLQDLVSLLSEMKAKGVDLFLYKQGLDTSRPSGKATFGMLGVFAELEREMIRERVMSGLARARAQGRRLGRPPIADKTRQEILAGKRKGLSVRKIVAATGTSIGSVQRVLADIQ